MLHNDHPVPTAQSGKTRRCHQQLPRDGPWAVSRKGSGRQGPGCQSSPRYCRPEGAAWRVVSATTGGLQAPATTSGKPTSCQTFLTTSPLCLPLSSSSAPGTMSQGPSEQLPAMEEGTITMDVGYIQSSECWSPSLGLSTTELVDYYDVKIPRDYLAIILPCLIG